MSINLFLITIILHLAAILSFNLFGSNLANNQNRKHYAILVAGSKDWVNYRHQAGVARVYKSLRNNGMPAENIIVIMYDDIALNVNNPLPGKLFDTPASDLKRDLYAGLKIDYKGSDATAVTYVNVLLGNKSNMKGIGTGRVLESTASDYVFLYYTGHGANGVIGFPTGEELYGDQINQIFKIMHDNEKYDKMVYYMGSCYSGSLFRNLIEASWNIYAVTASNHMEPSYACYCESSDKIEGKFLGVCLASEFDVKFVDYSDQFSAAKLSDSFTQTKRRTDSSEVSEYGKFSFKDRNFREFFGNKSEQPTKNKIISKINEKVIQIYLNVKKYINYYIKADKKSLSIDSYNVKIYSIYSHALQTNNKLDWNQYNNELRNNKYIDNLFAKFDLKLNPNKTTYEVDKINFECLRTSIQSYKTNCKNWGEYQMQYINNIVAACDTNRIETITDYLLEICPESF